MKKIFVNSYLIISSTLSLIMFIFILPWCIEIWQTYAEWSTSSGNIFPLLANSIKYTLCVIFTAIIFVTNIIIIFLTNKKQFIDIKQQSIKDRKKKRISELEKELEELKKDGN